jgi:hypothetical protein
VLDGQTTQRTNGWGDVGMVRDFYHQTLAVMCIVVMVVAIAFPLFNNPYFAHRRLTTSIV